MGPKVTAMSLTLRYLKVRLGKYTHLNYYLVFYKCAHSSFALILDRNDYPRRGDSYAQHRNP